MHTTDNYQWFHYTVIIINIISLFESFLYEFHLMIFHYSLSDSKSPQISRTHLSILADLNHSVVFMISILSLISNSSSLSF